MKSTLKKLIIFAYCWHLIGIKTAQHLIDRWALHHD
jgi:hypothetical protein